MSETIKRIQYEITEEEYKKVVKESNKIGLKPNSYAKMSLFKDLKA